MSKIPNLSARQAMCCFQQLHLDSFPEQPLLCVILIGSITNVCAFATKSVECQSLPYFHLIENYHFDTAVKNRNSVPIGY